METTKNKLSPYAFMFYKQLENYLETPLYFYGSIQRNDYVPNKSDIDVDIFSINVDSTITKIQNLLDIDKSKFKKFIYNIKNNIIPGYKFSIKRPEHFFRSDISIFDEKYKHLVLREHSRKFNLPFYISIIIIILKFLYYQLGIIPLNYFKYYKDTLIEYAFEPQSQFLVIDLKDEK
jgi:predicted nucleotidyltransferase